MPNTFATELFYYNREQDRVVRCFVVSMMWKPNQSPRYNIKTFDLKTGEFAGTIEDVKPDELFKTAEAASEENISKCRQSDFDPTKSQD